MKHWLLIISLAFGFLPSQVSSAPGSDLPDNMTGMSADNNSLRSPDENASLLENMAVIGGCPDYALFGQGYHPPIDSDWVASTSDDGSEGSILVFDNFLCSGAINQICFWGINGFYYEDTWYICYESPMEFEIRFYEDNNGLPGGLIASQIVECNGYQTGQIYNGAFELYEYYANLDQPVELEVGWISIQGKGDRPDCWFEWMSGINGLDSSGYQWDGIGLNEISRDRAFCLQYQEFKCGDIDGDNFITIYDVIYFIYYKYRGGPAPISAAAADVNRDYKLNITDIVGILSYLYKDGPTPVCR